MSDPDSSAALHGLAGELEIPTVESTAEALAASADEIPALMADARRTVAALAELATSADVQHVAGDIRSASASARDVLARADATFASIQKLLAEQSGLQIRVASAMDEISGGMRSIRHLADTLELQPESLLKARVPLPGIAE